MLCALALPQAARPTFLCNNDAWPNATDGGVQWARHNLSLAAYLIGAQARPSSPPDNLMTVDWFRGARRGEGCASPDNARLHAHAAARYGRKNNQRLEPEHWTYTQGCCCCRVRTQADSYFSSGLHWSDTVPGSDGRQKAWPVRLPERSSAVCRTRALCQRSLVPWRPRHAKAE